MPRRARAPFDLITVGDVTVDVFLKLADASVQCTLDRRNCLLCVRYADKVPVESVHHVPVAGNAANNAVGSVRLGLSVALAAILGGDAAGRVIRAALAADGVATDYITTDRAHRTNYSTVLNFRDERTILVSHEPRAYRLPPLASSAFFLYLTSMGGGWERIVPALLQYLKRAGAQLAFNPGTHQLATKPSTLRPLLRATSVLLVNREEAALLAGSRARSHPRFLLEKLAVLGPKTIVITDGPSGSYALHDHDAWFMPPLPVAVVENTGAGDAFSTGFLAAMIYGAGVADAQRWGTLNAASVIRQIGPQAGLLSLPEMRRWLRKYPNLVAQPLSR